MTLSLGNNSPIASVSIPRQITVHSGKRHILFIVPNTTKFQKTRNDACVSVVVEIWGQCDKYLFLNTFLAHR